MVEQGRSIKMDGSARRWLSGAGSDTPSPGLLRLLRLARGKRKRWQSTGRALRDKRLDQVAVEGMLFHLLDAGLIEIHQRRDKRGDWQPYEWQLTPAGEAAIVAAEQDLALEQRIVDYLQREEDPNHPVLAAIRAWLPQRPTNSERAARLAMAIGEQLSAGATPNERTIALLALGDTKAAPVAAYPAELEQALGCPPEQIVRRAGQAVYAFGPFEFTIRGRRIDGLWSRPWLALTNETIDTMSDLTTGADHLLTIENLTAFEEEIRRGLAPGTIALYTGGFISPLEARFIERLINSGIRQVHHWGDLDLGGLRIFRHLRDTVCPDLEPYRMSPGLLETLPTTALTERDRTGLKAWLQDSAAPLKPLAAAMIEKNQKAEQEGWYLLHSHNPKGETHGKNQTE